MLICAVPNLEPIIFITCMIHLPLAIIEGLAVGIMLCYLGKVKPELLNIPRRTSGLSLKSLKTKAEVAKIEVDFEEVDGLPADDFSESKLLLLWEAYINLLTDEGKKSVASVLATINNESYNTKHTPRKPVVPILPDVNALTLGRTRRMPEGVKQSNEKGKQQHKHQSFSFSKVNGNLRKLVYSLLVYF